MTSLIVAAKGSIAALTSKAAIAVAAIAALGGAAMIVIPAQDQDEAIWFDVPTMHQTFLPGNVALMVHVGRGQSPSQIRVDVRSLDFPDQPGATLVTKEIVEMKGDSSKPPAVPRGLFAASLNWTATPGKYRLLPSFDGKKGKYVIVTVAGLPKPVGTLPTPGQSATPSETPSATPSETPSIDPNELGPDGGELTPGTEGPGETLPPPPAPVIPPYGIVGQKQINASTQFTYRFTGSAIVPGSATARVFIRKVGVGADEFTAYACGPMTADPLDSNKRTCQLDWVSGAGNGFPIQVQYYLKVTANGEVFISPTDSFQAGRALG